MTSPRVIDSRAYVDAANEVLRRIVTESESSVTQAAELIVNSVRADGVVQAFGTGHSEALAMEVAGRAGGLVPTNKIALRDLVVLGGEDPAVLLEPKLEREPGIAVKLYELAAPRPSDIFVIGSNSGVNSVIVDMALLAHEKGHPVIAVTSRQHSESVPSRHESRRKLMDVADVVLDNGAPVGDSLLSIPGGGTVCAISSISGAFLVQMVIAEVISRMVAENRTPPVYLSANVPGGDEHNESWEQQYVGRIRRQA